MKKFRIVKAAAALGLSIMCACAITACSGDGTSSSGTGTGGVAATVNGVEIAEDTITEYIENLRAQYGLTDQDSWGEYLAAIGMTPESLRENIINSYASEELVKEAVVDQGITVDDDVVQGYVDTMKANYDTDAAWQDALSKVGLTEDEYRDEIKTRLESNEFMDTFTPEEEPSEEDQLTYAQMYATSYDGAKRSSTILFTSDDEATAQEVLDKVKSGDLDFAEAAKQYSADSSSAANGGDQGWDVTGNFDTSYTTALDELEKGDVSDLVTTDLGFQIIKCTDVYEAPKTTDDEGTETVEITSLDQVPSEWLDDIKDSVKEQKASEAYQEWVEQAQEEADIVINPMPEDVPYNVDMDQYTESDEEETDADANVTVDETMVEDVTVEEDADGTATVEAEATADETASDSDAATTDETAADSGTAEVAEEGAQVEGEATAQQVEEDAAE